MTELLKTLRLAFYVCALPLVATAIASAHSWINVDDDSLPTRFDQLETIEVVPAGGGAILSDVQAHVQHALKIDDAGGVTGRIMTRGTTELYGTPELNVTLNVRGNAVASTTTDANGKFRFDSVSPGAYTFIASSPTSITTFGVYVFADEAVRPTADTVQLSVAAAGSNVVGVREVLNSEVRAVAYSYTPTEAELPVVDELMQVDRDADGALSGRVVPLQWLEGQTRFNLTGNYVYLFDGAGMVAQVPVDAQGYYRIENVNPGIYDFVSFGPHGAAAMSIQVTGLETIASNQADTTFASSTNSTLDNGFDTVLGEPPAGPGTEVPVDVLVAIPQPGMGGYGGYPGGGWGGGGGYGAGGGGYGGMGDWGGIINSALGAWLLSQAFDNNGFGSGGSGGGGVITPPTILPPVTVPPVSPF